MDKDTIVGDVLNNIRQPSPRESILLHAIAPFDISNKCSFRDLINGKPVKQTGLFILRLVLRLYLDNEIALKRELSGRNLCNYAGIFDLKNFIEKCFQSLPLGTASPKSETQIEAESLIDRLRTGIPETVSTTTTNTKLKKSKNQGLAFFRRPPELKSYTLSFIEPIRRWNICQIDHEHWKMRSMSTMSFAGYYYQLYCRWYRKNHNGKLISPSSVPITPETIQLLARDLSTKCHK